jgi:hypothetical protein
MFTAFFTSAKAKIIITSKKSTEKWLLMWLLLLLPSVLLKHLEQKQKPRFRRVKAILGPSPPKV